MPETDLEIRGEAGGGGGWGAVSKKIFLAFRVPLWFKNKGGTRPLPWIRHCECIMLDCSSVTIIVVERKAKLH